MNILSDKKEVGKRILTLRKKNNETQKKLADVISTTPNTISKIENGEICLTFDNMLLIAEHYDVSLDYLCKGIGGENLLDTLCRYIKLQFHTYSGLDDSNISYNIPTIEIEKNYYDYLIQTANANTNKNIPNEVREQWLNIELDKFNHSIIKGELNEYIQLLFLNAKDGLANPDIVSALIRTTL